MLLYDKKTKLNVRIYYEDTDAGGVVYHSRYLNFAERARAEHLRNFSLNQKDVINLYKVYFVVRELEVKYFSFCKLDDLINIVTFIKEINRVKIIFSHTIYKKNEIINSMLIQICCINSRGVVARMPISLYDILISKGKENG